MKYRVQLLPGFVLLLALLATPALTFAQSVEGDVELLDTCTVEDKNGITHTFPKESSPSSYLAICALAKAVETGLLSSVQYDEFPGFGLFVEGINGTIAGGDEFWALWKNGGFADCGVECLSLSEGDTVSFILSSFEGEERGSSVVLHITALLQTLGSTPPAPSGGKQRPPPTFGVPAALAFLSEQQRADGSFGPDVMTDWAAIALASAGPSRTRDLVRLYLLTYTPSLSSITDYERHAMALMALSINPYTGASTNYITPIVEAFDGTQIGEQSLVNDDIFALFPLSKAGYSGADEVIQKTVAFIVSTQKPNGSWEESIDLTASAIQALSQFTSIADVNASVAKARTYLHDAQDTTGGWKNSFSTSWALQAVHALGEPLTSWTPDKLSPLHFLGTLQLSDGGLEPTSTDVATRVWATSYAIPAALGKPWRDILQAFPKPSLTATNEVGVVAGAATSTDSTNSQQASSEQATLTISINPSAIETVVTPSAPTSISPSPSPQQIQVATSSEQATTTTETAIQPQTQVAAIAETINSPFNEIWIWFSGLILVLCGAFVFLRRS